jgi:hypothetical protein
MNRNLLAAVVGAGIFAMIVLALTLLILWWATHRMTLQGPFEPYRMEPGRLQTGVARRAGG